MDFLRCALSAVAPGPKHWLHLVELKHINFVFNAVAKLRP